MKHDEANMHVIDEFSEVAKAWHLCEASHPKLPLLPAAAPRPNTPGQARELAQMLQDSADDPMWPDHSKVRKSLLARAAEALQLMANQVETLAELNTPDVC